MHLESTDVLVDLDPRLQRLVERKRRGITTRATSSTARGEVAVIARVDDPAQWRNASEVRPGLELQIRTSGSGSHLVTGRIPASHVEAVRRWPGVQSLKPPRAVRPVLAATTREMQARPELLPGAAQGRQGAGVVLGIIDFGCDFAHQNFRAADGKSRILALWDQSAGARDDSPFGYGRVYDKNAIDRALAAPEPYRALGYTPEPESHGTHVMDIAAGSGGGTGVPGVAPGADIVFVHLAASDIAWEGADTAGSNFGDSVQLLEAAKFIFDFAGDRPCAINISLGTNGGPHDGTTLVEQGLDQLIREKPNRSVVIAASNSHDDGIHASGKVVPNAAFDLPWQVSNFDQTSNELELWYSGKDEFLLELILPSGESLGTVRLGRNARVNDAGRTLLFVAHRNADPNNGDNLIDVFLEAGLPAGTWTLRLHPINVVNGSFHAWIERDDAGPSSFVPPLDNSHTLGSVSCGRETIVVGSYDAHRADTPISFFSSEGPTRDGRQKPEVSAPGHQVLAADATTVTEAIRMSGTSMAAPAATGVVALMLAEAKARGIALSSEEIRTILMSTARKQPGTSGWDPRFGQGRVDAAAAVAAVIARQ